MKCARNVTALLKRWVNGKTTNFGFKAVYTLQPRTLFPHLPLGFSQLPSLQEMNRPQCSRSVHNLHRSPMLENAVDHSAPRGQLLSTYASNYVPTLVYSVHARIGPRCVHFRKTYIVIYLPYHTKFSTLSKFIIIVCCIISLTLHYKTEISSCQVDGCSTEVTYFN